MVHGVLCANCCFFCFPYAQNYNFVFVICYTNKFALLSDDLRVES